MCFSFLDVRFVFNTKRWKRYEVFTVRFVVIQRIRKSNCIEDICQVYKQKHIRETIITFAASRYIYRGSCFTEIGVFLHQIQFLFFETLALIKTRLFIYFDILHYTSVNRIHFLVNNKQTEKQDNHARWHYFSP